MKTIHLLLIVLFISLVLQSCTKSEVSQPNVNLERAQTTLDSLYVHYGVPGSALLRETCPFDTAYSATYLASEPQSSAPNSYSYLWPYSGTFSAVNVLLEATCDKQYKTLLDNKVLKGLEEYYDCMRTPCGYASYVNSAPQSDRFYDDNVWLGIDFTDIYLQTKEKKYLQKAEEIWQFILSGTDDQLGGGIYWCEQKKGGKNTCSNAPGSVYALKLFEVTGDVNYLHSGKSLYEWTERNLKDTTDCLYYDNIKLDGRIGKAKYAYNSGQMMQAAALLCKLTGEKAYLAEAQRIAASCYNFFFDSFTTPEGESFRLLRKGDIWFTAVMLRGFIELYQQDRNPVYLDAFRKNLEYAWTHSRGTDGLFGTDWKGENGENKKWLLTQAAMVEMYARMAIIDRKLILSNK